jgi:hypothetical protein
MVTVKKSSMVKRESRYLENHEHESQQGDQLLNPSLEAQDFVVQLSRVHVEHLDRDDLGAWGLQPAARGGARDAILGGTADVLCRPDKFPKPVVIAVLSAGCGSHDPIMVPAGSRSTVRDGIPRAGRLCCRQLAQKSAECLDRQLRSTS